MKGYDAAGHWDRYAHLYEAMTAQADGWLDTAGCVAFLRPLAGAGPVLELGVGTGRVALPLAAEGVVVHGIDASPGMVERMRAKAGGDRIHVTIGDFSEVELGERFPLVFVVYSTFLNLTSAEAQVRCFANVARHLAPDGVFVLEADVPDVEGLAAGNQVQVGRVEAGRVSLGAVSYDPLHQLENSQMILVSSEGIELHPISIRYAWPSELDLMARLAGLELRERWADWRRTPFTAQSRRHVSVYARP